MKKSQTALLVAASLFLFNLSYGQWTTGTGNINNTNSGNVGIGTNTPYLGLLQINGSGSDLLSLSSTASNAIQFNAYNNLDFRIVQRSNAPMSFWTNTIERARFDQNGYFGVGTAVPGTRLHVVGSGSGINVTNPINGDGFAIQANTGSRSATTGAQLEFVIPANTDGSNAYGQGRIITVAGSAGNTDAAGKMIIGTRRFFNKLGTGSNWYYGDDITIDGAGNVGIGSSVPSAPLSIFNRAATIQINDADFNPGDGSTMGKLAFGSAATFASIETVRQVGSADDVTSLIFKNSFSTGAGGDGNNMERMRIAFNGNVGIGTQNPDQKLTVKGTIHSSAVKVDINIPVPDYVFNIDYKLKSLNDIRNYVTQNHHLPEIPSAARIQKEGIDLGQMNILLLKKVEELTLYLIAEKEANAKLAKRVDKIQQQLHVVKRKKR